MSEQDFPCSFVILSHVKEKKTTWRCVILIHSNDELNTHALKFTALCISTICAIRNTRSILQYMYESLNREHYSKWHHHGNRMIILKQSYDDLSVVSSCVWQWISGHLSFGVWILENGVRLDTVVIFVLFSVLVVTGWHCKVVKNLLNIILFGVYSNFPNLL